MIQKILIICIFLSQINSFGQSKVEDFYIPIELSYFPGYKYRIPWEVKLDNDTWIRMLNYPFAHLNTASELKKTNKNLYDQLSQKVLFKRKSCDSLVREYVSRLSKIDNWSLYGKEGGYKENNKNNDNAYWRCVCIPATELIGIQHDQKIKMGHIFKYFEPEPFVKKFKKFGLDSLNLEEAPYYSIFPLEIDPSFPCNKAATSIEKAICRNKTLAKLDKKLSEFYKRALKEKGKSIISDQKAWLQKREQQCIGKENDKIIPILTDLYIERINEINLIK